MPTLSSIQSLVFDTRCIEHHGDHAVEAGLNLLEGMSFEALVSAPSIQAALNLVEPNDPENSYLIHKLEDRAGIMGNVMPPRGDPLSAEEIEVIRQWIAAGAQNN